MATHHTGNFKHLTLSDRAEIEIMIEKGCSFSQMARAPIPLSFTAILWPPGRRDGWKRTMNLSAMFFPKGILSPG